MPTHPHVLAIGLDGILSPDGTVSSSTRVALGRARAVGLTLILVSERARSTLHQGVPDLLDAFDVVVSDNGAVVWTGEETTFIEAHTASPESGLAAALRGIGRPRTDVSVLENGEQGLALLELTEAGEAAQPHLAGPLVEEWCRAGDRVLVLDTHGDYVGLRWHPDIVVLGGPQPPDPDVVASILRWCELSVVIDLSEVDAQTRTRYAADLARSMGDLREETGIPRWIVSEGSTSGPGDEERPLEEVRRPRGGVHTHADPEDHSGRAPGARA